ncbi:MAG: hypothetical protein HQK79_19550 [Desulfobacterales bacterium]|nr:hypothetical protein [Desulfobacterales bacterium]MBF0396547.1 hypothetical protein [Desulfobacterales bacterium]
MRKIIALIVMAFFMATSAPIFAEDTAAPAVKEKKATVVKKAKHTKKSHKKVVKQKKTAAPADSAAPAPVTPAEKK